MATRTSYVDTDTSGASPKRRGEYLDVAQISRIFFWGHSLIGGTTAFGASDPEKDFVTHTGALLRAQDISKGTNGAVLGFHQQGTSDGGYAKVLQEDYRKQRGSSVITTTNPAIGATTVQVGVGHGVRFLVNDMINVGTGDTGATGGEVAWVASIAGDVLTLKFKSPTTGLVRDHAVGDPVYVITGDYLNLNPLHFIWYGQNDIGRYPIASALVAGARDRYFNPLEMIIARFRSAEVYENDHSSCVYSGSGWGAVTAATDKNSGANHRPVSSTAATVTIHVPDNFPAGGTVVLGFIYTAGTVGNTTVLSVSIDGGSAITKPIQATHAGMVNGVCMRLTGLAAGRHQIVVSVPTFQISTSFDWWGIEAPAPPFIMVGGWHRFENYTVHNTWANQQRTTTFTSLSGTTINVGSTTGGLVGQTISFANGDVREITAVVDADTFTINTALSSTPAGGSTVTYGEQDADHTTLDTLTADFIADNFDDAVAYLPTDPIFNKDPSFFWQDGAHLSDKGHAALAFKAEQLLQSTAGFTKELVAKTAVHNAPYPAEIVLFPGFTRGTATEAQLPYAVWINMPSGSPPWFGGSIHNVTIVDLRKVRQVRFFATIHVAGASGSGILLQVSPDNGTTWTSFTRSNLYAAVATELLMTATGLKDTGWIDVPAEVKVENAQLRIVGNAGNGTADPGIGKVACHFR